MASSLIGSLRVALGLDSAQFETGLKKSRTQASRDAASIQKSLSGITSTIKGFASGFVVTEIIQAGKRALDYASSLGEVSQQLGVTTKDLQVYRYAASQVGISQEEMDKGLSKLSVTIGKAAAGNKASVATFRELGVSITDANGKVNTAGQVIPKLADALAKVKDPATRARIEVELFGKTGQRLDTLLSGGSGAINELSAAAQKLGVVLSDEQIQKADETADKLAAIKMVLEANIASVVVANADSILSLANSFGALVSSIPEALKWYERWVNARRLGAPFESASGKADAKAALLGGSTADRRKVFEDVQARRRATQNFLKNPNLSATQRKDAQARLVGQDREFAEIINARNAAVIAAGRSQVPDMWGAGSSGALPEAAPGAAKKGKKPKDVKTIAELLKEETGRSPVRAAEETTDAIGQTVKATETAIKNFELMDFTALGAFNKAQAAAEEQARVDLGLTETIGKIDAARDEQGKAWEDSFARAREAQKRFTSDLADGLADALVYGGNIGDVLVSSFKRAAAEAISSGLFDLLRGGGSGGGAGGLFSSIASGLGSFFGGARASGGPVGAGRAYLVGEKGPELFMPNISGSIASNRMTQRITAPGNDNGSRVMIVPSPYFDVVVDHRAAAVAAPMAQQAVVGGASLGENRINRRNNRKLA
jgi:hypothetical protein